MILKIITRSVWNSTYTFTFLPKSKKSLRPCFYRAAEDSEPIFESFVYAALYSDKGKCLKRFTAFELSSLRCSLNIFDITSEQRKRFYQKSKIECYD